MTSIELADEHATRRLGERLGQLALAGDVFLLHGDLGAGKTTLVQGVAKGLGIADRVASPTFALVHELEGRLRLRHIDLYRLEPVDIEHLDADEWFSGDAVVAVEWAERLGAAGPDSYLVIALAVTGDARTATFQARGSRGTAIALALTTLSGATSRPD